MLQYEGMPDLYFGYTTPDGKADINKIRQGLLDEEKAIDLLAREIKFHSIRTNHPLSSWWSNPLSREDYVIGFATAKDKEYQPFTQSTQMGIWGLASYKIIKERNLLGNAVTY